MTSSIVSSVVIDASYTIRILVPIESRAEVEQYERWQETGMQLIAPDLWMIETVSILRRFVFQKAIKAERGPVLLDALFRLGVQVNPSDAELCKAAFIWAQRLGQIRAYDGLYLALVERLRKQTTGDVELWTADKRLMNRAHQIDVPWVRAIP